MAERTFGRFIRTAVHERLARVVRDGPAALRGGRGNKLHALRIAVKRLRYTLEFAAVQASGDAAPALELLARLQERLGAIADADAVGRTYARLLSGLPDEDPRRAGLRTLRKNARAERERRLADARALWCGNDGKPYPERLALYISSALDCESSEPAS